MFCQVRQSNPSVWDTSGAKVDYRCESEPTITFDCLPVIPIVTGLVSHSISVLCPKTLRHGDRFQPEGRLISPYEEFEDPVGSGD